MRPFDPPRGRATRPGNGAASVPSSPRPLRGVSAFSTLLSHLDECFDAHPGRCPLFPMEVDVQAEKRYPPPPAFIGQARNGACPRGPGPPPRPPPPPGPAPPSLDRSPTCL